MAGLGSQIPTWCVYVGDEEAEPTGTVYTCFSFGFAQDLASRMARDRHLPKSSQGHAALPQEPHGPEINPLAQSVAGEPSRLSYDGAVCTSPPTTQVPAD